MGIFFTNFDSENTKFRKKPLRNFVFSCFRSYILLAIISGCYTTVHAEVTAPNPYTFMPGEQVLDHQFYKPKDMITILPNRPLAARDKNGNRLYFTPDGKLTLKISVDGTQEFSLTSVASRTKDKKGELTEEMFTQQGSNLKMVKDGQGELVKIQELGFGGRTVKEYDAEKNLIKSYKYNRYGKNMEWVNDELSQTKTVFNDKGQAINDIDFEGYKIATYQYDNKNKLKTKTDVYGNKTYFDKHGNMEHTEDFDGNVIVQYKSGKDEDGNWILKTSKDNLDNVTIFENNNPSVIKNWTGTVVKEYVRDGTKLIYTFDTEKNEITWYNKYGKPIYTTYNEILVSKWLYYQARHVGLWNQSDSSTLVYRNEREEVKIQTGEQPPTAEEIQKWVDEGLIEAFRK